MRVVRNVGIGEEVIKCINYRDHCNKKSNISVNTTCFFSFCHTERSTFEGTHRPLKSGFQEVAFCLSVFEQLNHFGKFNHIRYTQFHHDIPLMRANR